MYILTQLYFFTAPSNVFVCSSTTEINSGMISLTGCHIICSITVATESNAGFPLGSPEFHYQAGRGGGLWGGLYQHIQTQLTSTPMILFAGCICWVGDLSLKAGQMLNFLIWHISEAKSSSRGSTALSYFLYMYSTCFLPMFYVRNLWSWELT